ncbi:MAG: adenylate/guanylate cyclase domain-containing protein [Pseudomonadota bacterium]
MESVRIGLSGLYLRNVGSNLLGLITVMALNIFTPLETFKIPRAFFFEEGGWVILALLYPLIVGLICFLQYNIQRPVSGLIERVGGEEGIGNQFKERARRRLLNLPFIIGLVNLTLWIMMPLSIMCYFYFFKGVPIKTGLFLLFRTIMIGLIAAYLSFFLVEDYSRRTLIPLFFPKGRLTAIPMTIKISILRRIRILYAAGTSVPMIILVGTISFSLWDMGNVAATAQQLGREILLFSVLLCSIFFIIALRLNFLVGKSILNPIGEMLSVVEKVRGGDFNQRIRVLSNDEIGILGDTGNDMIAGLAERERIRDTFGKYVTPEIRDQILTGRIPLDGERRKATLLFSDLRGFTHYVEKTPPEEVIRSMRAYFTAMQRAIRHHQGLVLQYVGDEVEAVFGVPLSHDGHADQAVLAALEMRNALEGLNKKREEGGKPPFRHGVGIHTGIVLAGNTGSEDRLSYALVGDTVNLASRIQELTKTFNCDILVSEETVRMLENGYQMERESPLGVRGSSRPITVFRLL